ncbi:MAG: cupin domain-containing protein [Planctomycetota bacterium]|nr:cupin domain-containing protein [Planctomycetota bacterium]
MPKQDPILSAPGQTAPLNIGASSLVRRIRSDQTRGEFSVVEFVSPPGEGVGAHVHEREDELVYLLEGEIEVTLGENSMKVPTGACALLPRGIPHGYVNTGAAPSRLLAILMPGKLDEFFVALDRELALDREHDGPITELCGRFGLTFLEKAST